MFHDPFFLLLLLTLPFVVWRLIVSNRHEAIPFSSAISTWNPGRSWRQRLVWLPPACTVFALALMIISMARPREGRQQTINDSEGIAIELVVDRSGSMQALDFMIDGKNVDRLTAIKNVAGRFVVGDENGSSVGTGRFNDLVGLITFAGYADAVTPPTLDHNFLVAQLNKAEIVTRRNEDGTAIGDGLSLAVEKLDSLDQRKEEKIKSKVIILLTDGENTAGEMDPLQAAEMAAAMGIKVYTIGVGTRGLAPVPVRDPFSGRVVYRQMEVNIDEETLNEIAEQTGGKYFRATDTQSLESIYAEIDQMEKTKVESQSFVDYRELAVQPIRFQRWRVPPLLLIALILLATRIVLNQTILRQFP